jgi:predicted small lipoprotein YifL
MKSVFSAILVVFLLFLFGACSKKEEQPVPQAPKMRGPIIDSPALQSKPRTGQRAELKVVVPQEVKDSWSSVKLLIEDNKLKKTEEFTVKLGDELKIPDSKLTVKVGDFLPDFKMGIQIITSASNNLVNPAVGIKISENGTQIFPLSGKWGWLYVKHPMIHPFQHDRFKVLLKEGVKK